MVETTPKYYTNADGYAMPVWDRLPKKIEPMRQEPKISHMKFWVCAFGGVGLFWIIAIIFGVMTQ